MAVARLRALRLSGAVTLLGLSVLAAGRLVEAQQPGSPAATADQPARPRLVGVVIRQGGGRAYLQDAQTGGVRAYQVGESVGDARLVAIEPDRVVLEHDGTRSELRFGGLPAAGAAPAAEAAAAPDPAPAPPAASSASPDPGSDPAPGQPAGGTIAACPPDCSAAPAPGQVTCPPYCVPAAAGTPAAPSEPVPGCPPNCPTPAVPVGPAPRP